VVYLKWLLERFESNLELALAAYNAGEATVTRYRGVPPVRETRDYLARIYRTLGIAAAGAPGPAIAASAAAAR
jgi:soluble lytic murein transglycosylase-like protein